MARIRFGHLMVNIRSILSLALSASFLGVTMAGEPLGLVLSGGAAKGAYEVGVWQALVETDLANDVSVISGASVGAINASLFASLGDTNKCTRLWEEEIGAIFQFNTNLMVKVLGEEGRNKIDRIYSRMRRNIAEDMAAAADKRGCSVSELPQYVKDKIEGRCESVARKRLLFELPIFKTIANMCEDYEVSRKMEGFLSISSLYSIILRELPRSWRCDAPTVYATTVRKDKDKYSIETFSVNKGSPENRASIICASACLPFLFGAYKVNGLTYIDGGIETKGGDNVPVGAILENHPKIKTIIVVFLSDKNSILPEQLIRVRNAAMSANVRLVEIIPSININGALGFLGYVDDSKKNVKRLIDLGRKDAEAALKKAGMWKKARK